jgi:hypothetical protein
MFIKSLPATLYRLINKDTEQTVRPPNSNILTYNYQLYELAVRKIQIEKKQRSIVTL